MTDTVSSSSPSQRVTISNDEKLNIDQMLARYPLVEVENAVCRLDYPGRRDAVIQQCEELIARGINVESCREGIKWAIENMPATRPVDPEEPQHLHPDVLWRIQFLKYMFRDTSNVFEKDLENVHAILDAYRTGKLHVDPDKVTVWFGGNMVMGPLSRWDFKFEDLNAPIDGWWERFGPGTVWVEQMQTFPA